MSKKTKIKEPNYPAILHFTSIANGDGEEYIVIANEGPIKDHAINGFECHSAMEIDAEGSLPVNEPLWKR